MRERFVEEYPMQAPVEGNPPSYELPGGTPGYAKLQEYPPQYAPQGFVVTPQQQPGQNIVIRQTQVQPNDHMAFAIIVTLFCCLPFGIVAIVKSTDVRNRFVAGDYQGAEQSSQSARKWSIAGLATGVSIYVVVGILYGIAAAIGASSPYRYYSYNY